MNLLILAGLAYLLFFRDSAPPTVDIRQGEPIPGQPAQYNYEIRDNAGNVFTQGVYNDANRLLFQAEARSRGWTILRELRVE